MGRVGIWVSLRVRLGALGLLALCLLRWVGISLLFVLSLLLVLSRLLVQPVLSLWSVRLSHLWVRPNCLCARPRCGWAQCGDVFPKEHFTFTIFPTERFTGNAYRVSGRWAMASLRRSARSGNTRHLASGRATSTGQRAGSHLQRFPDGRPVMALVLRAS